MQLLQGKQPLEGTLPPSTAPSRQPEVPKCQLISNTPDLKFSAVPNLVNGSVYTIGGLPFGITAKFRIGSHWINFLIDTAASVSLIKENIVPSGSVVLPCNLQLHGISGSKIQVLGQSDLHLHSRSASVRQNFKICPKSIHLQQDALLGADFLLEHNVTIDFPTRTLRFGNNQVNMAILRGPALSIFVTQHSVPPPQTDPPPFPANCKQPADSTHSLPAHRS